MSTMLLPVMFWLTAILIVAALITEFCTRLLPIEQDAADTIAPPKDAEKPG